MPAKYDFDIKQGIPAPTVGINLWPEDHRCSVKNCTEEAFFTVAWPQVLGPDQYGVDHYTWLSQRYCKKHVPEMEQTFNERLQSWWSSVTAAYQAYEHNTHHRLAQFLKIT